MLMITINIIKISKMLFPNNVEFLNKRDLVELEKNKIDCVCYKFLA